ncbi:MAG: hypothetical protein JWQ98_980 [Chlorobi bacterium]|nr:hypothetical protein [Chlorobiota bacterium]
MMIVVVSLRGCRRARIAPISVAFRTSGEAVIRYRMIASFRTSDSINEPSGPVLVTRYR